MGTRGTIVVTGKDSRNKMNNTTRLYKNNDCAPDYVLGLIAKAIKTSIDQCKADNERWGDAFSTKHVVNDSQLLGHLIGCDVSVYGMDCAIDQVFSGYSFERDHLGQDGIYIEYSFLIDIDSKSVTVFKASGDIIDPRDSVKRYVQEVQADRRASIDSKMNELEALGFKVVMPKPVKAVKPKASAKKPAAKTAKLKLVTKGA